MAEANVSEDLISKLTHVLTTVCNPSRAPDHFDKKLKAACEESDASLSRTLLGVGFKVWFAYFGSSQQGHAGELDQLDSQTLAFVTDRIAHVPPHQSVVQLFSHLFDGSRSGKARLNWLKAINVEAPASPKPPSSDCRPPRRPRLSLQDIAMQNEGGSIASTETTHDLQHSAANTSNAEAGVSNTVALYGSIGFHLNTGTQVAFPAASCLGYVFPMYLTDVVVKANGNAWLRASFNDPAKCELDCFVSTSETQHIAKELFDVHIATKDQLQGILLDNNVLLGINGSVILSGLHPEKLKKIFGIQVAEAFQFSPRRLEELEDGLTEVTRCLEMEIWPDVDCPSRLKLIVDVARLSVIARCLWPGLL